jgi:putative ATP-dependent endonuclease of OLD family
MKLVRLKTTNFRNLDGAEIFLDPDINFLIGENDLGKSNLLDMLEIVFNHRRFSEEDFLDAQKPIEIEFSLTLNEIEKGIFEDLFDPAQNNVINIIANQEAEDEDIRYFHKETEEEVFYTKFRCVNYVKYDSLRMPKEELTFHKGRGVGKFLVYLVEKLISQGILPAAEDYIKKESLSPVVAYINSLLTKIRLFKDFVLTAAVEEELTDLIYRILTIKDSRGFQIQKIGYGVQFSVLIVLSILEKLMSLVEDKRRKECIFTKDQEKSISLILGLDEPEIHLHPYMQRSVVKYIKNILQNKDKAFSSLTKELFDIDSIDGQAIIASHSPTVLLNQYKNIVRFYRENSMIKIISGSDIHLDESVEKHLLKNFPYIKEAFFCRCAIMVEGDTEYAALPLWAEKVIGDLDELGITVIQAGGAKSVPPVVKLLNELKIPNVSIIDKDEYNGSKTAYDQTPNLYVTDNNNFEEELVGSLIAHNQTEALFDLLQDREPSGLETRIQKTKLAQIAGKYTIKTDWPEKDYNFSEIHKKSKNMNLLKAMFLSWLDKKSITLGRAIGEKVEAAFIPAKYKSVIQKAETLCRTIYSP